jgi:hypothetical protein
MTQRDGMSPALVSIASPEPDGGALGRLALDRRPPARWIASATPPPCSSWVFAGVGDRVDLEPRDVRVPDLEDGGRHGPQATLRPARPCPEALAPALDGRDELREVHLERVEDLVGVVLGAQADLPLAGAGVVDDVLRGALGLAGDLLVGDQRVLLLARLLDDPLGLPLGLASISWRSLTIQRACLISSGIVARIWSSRS